MKAHRLFLCMLPVLAALLWLVWPAAEKSAREVDSRTGSGEGKHHLGDRVRAKDGDGDKEAASGIPPKRVNGGDGSTVLSGVDRVLAIDGISDEQAALQLREIAMNPLNSVEDRLNALQHGLNLHVDTFADFAKQKDLPSELASPYLHEMINHNDSPSIQIGAYMALMDHPDAEVAGLAKEMLAMDLGDDERQSTREKLLVAAQSKLAKLASEGGN